MKPKPGKGKIEDKRNPQPLSFRAPIQQLITGGKEDTRDPPPKPRIPAAREKGTGANDLGPNKLTPKPSPKRAAAGRKKISNDWGAWWEPATQAKRRSAKRKQA